MKRWIVILRLWLKGYCFKHKEFGSDTYGRCRSCVLREWRSTRERDVARDARKETTKKRLEEEFLRLSS